MIRPRILALQLQEACAALTIRGYSVPDPSGQTQAPAQPTPKTADAILERIFTPTPKASPAEQAEKALRRWPEWAECLDSSDIPSLWRCERLKAARPVETSSGCGGALMIRRRASSPKDHR